jgi:transposase
VKILIWDGSGLILIYKRLEEGKFRWPRIEDGVMKLSPAQLSALFEGLDWSKVRAVRRQRPPAPSSRAISSAPAISPCIFEQIIALLFP